MEDDPMKIRRKRTQTISTRLRGEKSPEPEIRQPELPEPTTFHRMVSLQPSRDPSNPAWGGGELRFQVTRAEDPAASDVASKNTAEHLRLGGMILAMFLAILAAGVLVLIVFTGGKSRVGEDVRQKELAEQIVTSRFSDAWRTLESLRESWSNDPRLYQAEGALQMLDRRDYERAAELFRAALALDPDNAELTFYLAEALFAAKRYGEAERLYQAVSRNWKDNEILPYRFFLCAALLGDSERALAIIEKSEASYQSPSWFYIRATDAFWRGDPGTARQLVESARVLHREKARMFDLTLAELGFR